MFNGAYRKHKKRSPKRARADCVLSGPVISSEIVCTSLKSDLILLVVSYGARSQRPGIDETEPGTDLAITRAPLACKLTSSCCFLFCFLNHFLPCVFKPEFPQSGCVFVPSIWADVDFFYMPRKFFSHVAEAGDTLEAVSSGYSQWEWAKPKVSGCCVPLKNQYMKFPQWQRDIIVTQIKITLPARMLQFILFKR